MSTSNAAVNFDSSMPRVYSGSWREAYGQDADTPRRASYQAPDGKPIYFVFDSISVGGGQNVDTAEYPYGYWSNTRLGEKPHTLKLKGHLIGENYIAERSKFVAALQVSTDDDNPATLDLPLWGRFSVVVTTWDVGEDKGKTGSCEVSIDFVRAGYSETKRFEEAGSNLAKNKNSIDKAVSDLKDAASNAFSAAVEKQRDIVTLSQDFAQVTKKLASIAGRVQGAITVLNTITNKINGITNLIAQGMLIPKNLAQAFISAVFGIGAGILEIKNAADETASYFSQSHGWSSLSGDAEDFSEEDESSISSNSNSTLSRLSAAQQEAVMKKFIARNEKNVLRQFLAASTFTLDDEALTEQQFVTKKAIENLYKTVAFGVCAQLITQLDADAETYESQSGLWELLEKLEESIDKEDSDVFAAAEECRIACAQMLLSSSYNAELHRAVRKSMPLLELALYLACDGEKIRALNSISDSFLIKGDVIYV